MAELPILQYYRQLKQNLPFADFLADKNTKDLIQSMVKMLQKYEVDHPNEKPLSDENISGRMEYLLEQNLLTDDELTDFLENSQLDDAHAYPIIMPIVLKYIATVTETEVTDVMNELPNEYKEFRKVYINCVLKFQPMNFFTSICMLLFFLSVHTFQFFRTTFK